MMDYAALSFWWQVAMTIMNAIGVIYIWLVSRNRVTRERISELQDEMDDKFNKQGERLARVEQDLSHLPGDHEVERIHERIDEVGGAIKRLEGEFSGANRTLQLIHEYLLNGGRK